MVARGGGDHAAAPLLLAESRHQRHPAAHLEGAGRLDVLMLDDDVDSSRHGEEGVGPGGGFGQHRGQGVMSAHHGVEVEAERGGIRAAGAGSLVGVGSPAGVGSLAAVERRGGPGGFNGCGRRSGRSRHSRRSGRSGHSHVIHDRCHRHIGPMNVLSNIYRSGA